MTVNANDNTMRGTLTDEEIAARNVIPATNPAGEPHRILAEEYMSEVDTFTTWVHDDRDEPGPAAGELLKPGVLREAHKISDRVGNKTKPTDPDYWGLASVMTEEEAALTANMKVRVPMTLPELVSASGLPEARVQELLDDMAVKGIIEYNWENPTRTKQYVLPMFVPGSAEFTLMNQKQLEEHPELSSFFERMAYLPLTKVTKMVPPGGAGIGMHVIPVERAIAHENQSADVEHISHWLKKYDRYAAGSCSCRLGERARGEGSPDDPQEWCIGVGDMADYLVETGKGHFITYDQVIETLIAAEKNGFVHQITNIDGEDKIFAICNCQVNVCHALRTSQLFNTPNLSRSAYVARVDEAKCVACGRCVEVCPAGAAKLGQKLPTKNGRVAYPVQPLPDDNHWGEEDWDWDYKDHHRIECHETGTAPCKVACPAHVPVQGYLRMAAEGRYTEALALIKCENPFPAVCGRVCNRRCEAACTRGTVDEAVAIDEVKKFVAEKDLDAETRYVPEPTIPSMRVRFSQKVAVVGAGPAGLSCAYYLAELGYEPVVFEKNPLPGGMMTYGIPAYKLSKQVVAAEIDVLRQMGVQIRCGVEVGRDVTLAELREQGFCAFYLAVGAQGGRMAGVPGEDAAGVDTAVDFLRRALEDPDHEVRGTTVVVGGGNVAIDAARVSARCGASEVHIVCLEQPGEMPALPEEIAEAKEDGVKIRCGWGPESIEVDDGHIRGVSFKRCTRVFDESGRFSPVYEESDTMFVPCDNVVLSIGQSIEWGDLLDGSRVELGRGSAAVANPQTYQTAEPDVFVGGDDFTGPKFVIDAIAAGHGAAVSIHRYAQKASLTIGRNQRHYVELDKSDVVVDPSGYDHAGRQQPKVDHVAHVLHDWTDTRHTFTEDQVKTECARCLKCGASIVDANRCIGCGLCTTRCEFDAIHLRRDNPECSTMVPSEDKMKAILPHAAKRGIKLLLRGNKTKPGKK